MRKSVYRIMGIIVSFALAMGGFTKVEATPSQPAASDKPVYAYYYLWWSDQHWEDKLGANYPYNTSPLPLPATTDVNGCNAVSSYGGNQLLDVPTTLVSQDDPGAIEDDIRLAKKAGLAGFWLNWSGDGTTSQTRTSVSYTRRLSEAFAASKRVGGFKNWVSYKAAAREPADHIVNDLNFLYKEFKGETAWEKIDGKPVVTFTGSRAYSDADVQMISSALRDRIYLVGDESRQTMTSARIKMFDAITYYWSSQDPWGNPQSFDQIKEMGDKVHAAGKKWYAPLNSGYNSSLLDGGTCIPRKNGETLRTLWKGNLASRPDGWGMISWNEIAENTHIKPMQKWGNKYLNVLAELIDSGPQSPSAPAPVTAGNYDDAHSAWTYVGNWTSWSGDEAYNSTLHYTQTVGDFAALTFKGTQFTLVYTKYMNRGSIDVYVDNSHVTTIDAYASSPDWQYTYTSPTYSDGTHTVRLVHAGGDVVDVDAIQIMDKPSSSPATDKFDDTHDALAYSSSAWQDQTTDNAYKGSYKETTKNGSFVTISFTGQSFSVLYKGGVTYGKMDVYVDDKLVATINQKTSETTYQKRWKYPDKLSSGKHTLKLVFRKVSSTINKGSLDAIIIE
ncbi:MAG TPA: hypothetical protein VHP14_00620 [Anaerolineales bacterium]|nr:hypothetical protein [Anaerolineales bacterium]